MNIAQIIVKTVITTVDLLLIFAVAKANNMKDAYTKAAIALVVMNILGAWS